MSRNEELKTLEQIHFFDMNNDILDTTYKKKQIILPNLHPAEESSSFYLEEYLFTIYFDNIIKKTFNKNINNICLFKSTYVSDYFIELDFLNFKYKIPNILLKSFKNCKNNNDIRFYIIPLKLIFNYTDAHSNVIIIDNDKMRIEFFEPHGDSYKGSSVPYDIETYIKKLIELIFPIRTVLYDFINVQKSCPIGLQTKQSIINPSSGFCLAWSLLFINIRLINLNLNSDDIIDYFNSFSSEDLNIYIKRFIGFLEQSSQIITKTLPNYEMKINLLESDKVKISKRISELVNEYLNAKTEKESGEIFKELISYHNFPTFNELFFNTVNNSKSRKKYNLDPNLMSPFAFPM
jgi:hypothetical protein